MHGVARGSLDIKIAFAKIAFRFYVKLSPWTGSWTHALCRICTALRTKPQNWQGLRGFPLACPLFMTCFLLRSGFKIPECRHARMHGQGRCWDWASSLSLGTGNARRSELAKSSVRFVFPVFSLHAEFCSARRMGMIELQGDKARRGRGCKAPFVSSDDLRVAHHPSCLIDERIRIRSVKSTPSCSAKQVPLR